MSDPHIVVRQVSKVFKTPGRDVVALWVDRDGIRAELNLAPRRLTSVVNMWGQEIGMIGPAPHVSVAVGDGPVYVTWTR